MSADRVLPKPGKSAITMPLKGLSSDATATAAACSWWSNGWTCGLSPGTGPSGGRLCFRSCKQHLWSAPILSLEGIKSYNFVSKAVEEFQELVLLNNVCGSSMLRFCFRFWIGGIIRAAIVIVFVVAVIALFVVAAFVLALIVATLACGSFFDVQVARSIMKIFVKRGVVHSYRNVVASVDFGCEGLYLGT